MAGAGKFSKFIDYSGSPSVRQKLGKVLPFRRPGKSKADSKPAEPKVLFGFLDRYIDRAELEPEPAQIASFHRYWQMGDPLADALVNAIQKDPKVQLQWNEALGQGVDSVSDPRPELSAFCAQAQSVPVWLDRNQLAAGCDAINRVGIFGIMSLADVALMGGYVVGSAAQTLVSTGQLDQMALRRLMETAHWWRLVTTPGGLDPLSEGVQSTLRVRVIHAHVRAALIRKGDWNYQRYGLPLNQMLLVGTLMLFGQIYFASLESIGFRFSSKERKAILHLWRYVGYLMGIDEGLLPVTEEDGLRLILLLERHTLDPNEASYQLAGALSETFRSVMSVRGPLSKPVGEAWLALHSEYSRLVLGDGAANALGLPKSAQARRALRGIAAAVSVAETLRPKIPGATKFAAIAGERFRKYMLDRDMALHDPDLTYQPRFR